MYAGPLDNLRQPAAPNGRWWTRIKASLKSTPSTEATSRILDDGGTNKPIESVVFAQFIGGGNNELAYSRDIDPPLASLIVKSYENGGFTADVLPAGTQPQLCTDLCRRHQRERRRGVDFAADEGRYSPDCAQ